MSYQWWSTASFRRMRLVLFWHLVHLTNWVINGLGVALPQRGAVDRVAGLAWLPFIMQRLDNEYMMPAPLTHRRREIAERRYPRHVLHQSTDGDSATWRSWIRCSG